MNSKHDILTEAEINRFTLRADVLHLLDDCAARFGTSRKELRVLDWGCGRGRTVIKLLEMGIDAYGVDIDPGPIGNGVPLFQARGEDERRLVCIGPDCRTPFADGFFDVVISDQVFEHVRDLDALAAELVRVTKPGGAGWHIFPAKWRVIEPHLFVPCVHWLPKNRLRRWYLRLMLKRIPVWKGLEGKPAAERVQVYYDYSVQKTYYRPLRHIRRILRKAGLDVRFDAKIHGFRHLRLLDVRLLSTIRSGWSNRFREVTLFTLRR